MGFFFLFFFSFIFIIVSYCDALACVHVLFKCLFHNYLNVWQAVMFCAMCLFELIKKCLILSYYLTLSDKNVKSLTVKDMWLYP